MHHLANRLTILAIAVVVTLLVTFLILHFNEKRYSADDENMAFLPHLQENLSMLKTIEITQADQSLVIEKRGSEWILSQNGGYPVDVSKVRQLALSLADLEKIEPKTSDADRLVLLGLDMPSKEHPSTRVVLFNSNGEALADVILGSFRRAQGERYSQGAFYIRNSNEDQAWLVKGDVELTAQVNDWVNRELLRLNPKHIASVTIDHPGKKNENVRIRRSKKEDETSFTLANIPSGKLLISPMDIEAIVDVPKQLNFLEVVSSKDKEFSKKKAVKTTYTMDGNLEIILHIWEEKEDSAKDAATIYWLSVEHNVTSADENDAIKSVTERLKQYEGWLYKIGGYQGKLLTKELSKLVKKK